MRLAKITLCKRRFTEFYQEWVVFGCGFKVALSWLCSVLRHWGVFHMKKNKLWWASLTGWQ